MIMQSAFYRTALGINQRITNRTDMKRIYFTLIALMATLVVSAQTIEVYEYNTDGSLKSVPAYTSTKKVKVIFKEIVHEYVDLGLPSGTLWATCNVGADKPEDFGDYFAWGETTPKDTYDEESYKWMNDGWSTWTQINKYTVADGQFAGRWYYGGTFIGDNKTELLPEDDAATANWGSDWRMPTHAQQMELLNSAYTEKEWTTVNGVNGYKITSKTNGKSIFLPVAGYLYYGSIYDDSYGAYWSREVHPNRSDLAWRIQLGSDYIGANDHAMRFYGLSVRPVRK